MLKWVLSFYRRLSPTLSTCAPAGPHDGGVVLRVRPGDPQQHQHVAVADRGGPGGADDAGAGPQVSRGWHTCEALLEYGIKYPAWLYSNWLTFLSVATWLSRRGFSMMIFLYPLHACGSSMCELAEGGFFCKDNLDDVRRPSCGWRKKVCDKR